LPVFFVLTDKQDCKYLEFTFKCLASGPYLFIENAGKLILRGPFQMGEYGVMAEYLSWMRKF